MCKSFNKYLYYQMLKCFLSSYILQFLSKRQNQFISVYSKVLLMLRNSLGCYRTLPGSYKVLKLSASPDDLCKFHYYSAVHRYFSALCSPYIITAWCTTTLQCTELQAIRAQLGACHDSLQLSVLMILCSAFRATTVDFWQARQP